MSAKVRDEGGDSGNLHVFVLPTRTAPCSSSRWTGNELTSRSG